MSNHILCGSPLKAEVIRVTRTNICGVPVVGSGSAQITSRGFISVQSSPQYEDGQRFFQRRADGEACVNELDDPIFNWLEQTVQVCVLDPDMLVVVTGGNLHVRPSDMVGTGYQQAEGKVTSRFSLELWTKAAGDLACTPGGETQYFYFAFPHVGGARLQQFTNQNDVFEFGWQHVTHRSASVWDLGDPWMVDGEWGDNKHWGWNITTVAPPVAACGASELVAA